METSVTVERVEEDEEMEEDLPSHEILRENLKRKTRGKRTKTHFAELKCHVCLKVCPDRAGLHNHVQIHNAESPYPCRQCSYKGKTKKYLARHTKRVHGGPPTKHVCDFCGKGFHYRSGLMSHERVHTGAKPYVCDVCGKSFSARYSWQTHKLIHTDDKPFKCPYCDYACRDNSTIRRHKERHMGTLKMHECGICLRRFDSKCKLKTHVQEAHVEPEVRRFACPHCDSKFKQERILNNHIDIVHNRSKKVICPVCGVTVSCHYNLKAHLRRHIRARPYRCNVDGCTSSFKDRQALKKHNAIHDMSQHVICDVCGKTFSRKHRLAAHLRHHRPRVKQEQCRFCGDKFYTKQYLIKHIKQKHSRKRPKYICDMCDFVTHNKPSIVMHIKHGHNTGKGKCKICNKPYKRNVHLRLHYWNTHGVRFKTYLEKYQLQANYHSRLNVLPEMEVQVKQEPLDLIPDLEFDLFDIEKEEPFAGFEPTESELSRIREKEQTLQQFLHQVMHVSVESDGHTSRSPYNLTAPSNKIDNVLESMIDTQPQTTAEIEDASQKTSKNKKTKIDQKSTSKNEVKEDQITSLNTKEAKGNSPSINILSQIANQEVIDKETDAIDEELHNNIDIENTVYTSTSKDIDKPEEIFTNIIKQDNIIREDDEQHYMSCKFTQKLRGNAEIDIKENRYQTIIVKPIQALQKDVEVVQTQNSLENDKLECTNEELTQDLEDNVKVAETQEDTIDQDDDEFSMSARVIEADNAEVIQTQQYMEEVTEQPYMSGEVTIDLQGNSEVIQTYQYTERTDDEQEFYSSEVTEAHQSNAEVIHIQQKEQEVDKQQYITTKVTDNMEVVDTQQNLQEDELPISEVTQDVQNTIEAVQHTIEVGQVVQLQNEDGQGPSYMPVEEFIQRVIGDADERSIKEETMMVDTQAKEDVEQRLRDILVKMRRMASGKPGAMRERRKLRLVSPEEIEKTNMETSSQPKQVVNNEKPDDGQKGKKELPDSLKQLLKMHQCYICFKLFETKPKLIDHCKTHFDVCNETTLKKCPMCPYVTTKSDIKRHLKRKHGEDVRISFMDIMDRKDNATGSRYYYDTKNENIKELEIIPSIKILNKKASMELDRKNRERNNKFVGKRKLVRKGNEWIVEKEKLDLSDHVLPDSKDLDKNSENYLEVIKKLGKEAKRKGVKMLYPCNKCEKICQNLSALTLHGRRHDPNPKPFKPRGAKSENSSNKKEIIENIDNRTANPKPIVNNHKCDPKLMDFYEKNIKGADIEFWQFLKIYNKMNREKVNSFKDLEGTTEFGIHFDMKTPEINLDDIPDLEVNCKRNSRASKTKDFPKGLNRKFIRTIRLTKVEYNKRLEIKNKMREKLKCNDG